MGVVSDGTTVIDNGAVIGVVSWQSAIKTTSFTAVAGEGYWVNTTSSAITITLPASASVGDQIIFTDYARTWGTNAVTVNQNSLNFQGSTSPNPEYNTNGQSVNIVYSGATKGWIPTSDDDVALETPQSVTVDFLVIAGGGAAGYDQGGGGGAGGYRNSYSTESSGGGGSSETSLTLTQGTTYTITIGAGGTGIYGTTTPAGEGNDSSISGSGITTITSIGGGRGGNGNQPSYPSSTGGSGGGGAGGGTPGSSGTANQGFAGGNGNGGGGAGGGGAGAASANSTPTTPSAGGAGLASSITGSSVSRGGGGGSMNAASVNTSLGGVGGGGNGSTSKVANGNPGTANTGGGGGGVWNLNAPFISGSGGSGVVILRLPTADYSGTTTGSPTVSTSGLDTILTYTGSGSYTA